MPLLGLMPAATDEPVRLIVTNPATGHRAVHPYDVVQDVYWRHPEAWPKDE